MARSIIEHTSKFMNQPRLLTSSDDMDNLTQAGFYTQADNELPANAPSDNPNNAGIIVLKARAGAETIQIWFSVNSATCWYRAKGAYTTWGSWHKVMVGGVISKLLSEVMTASGGRHDEYHPEAESAETRHIRMETGAHSSDASRNISVPDYFQRKNNRMPDMGRRYGILPRRGFSSSGNEQLCPDGRHWLSVGAFCDLLPMMAKEVA